MKMPTTVLKLYSKQNFHEKLQRSIIIYKKVSRLELRFFISAHHLIMLYILPSFTRISQRVSELLGGHYFPTKIGEGHNTIKNIGGLTVLILCISPGGALYWYQAS